MQTTNAIIGYCIDSARLDVSVRDGRIRSMRTRQILYPWLTICLEPISQTVLASECSYDPPDALLMKSLVYQALAPSSKHLYGRMPDELWVDRSPAFMTSQSQHVLEYLQITIRQVPTQYRGTPERLFGSLSLYLQHEFPPTEQKGTVSSQEPLSQPSLFELEVICRQWLDAYPLTAARAEAAAFLSYCEAYWRAYPLDPRSLDDLLELAGHYPVTKEGIRYKGQMYKHPALDALRGQEISLRAVASHLPPPQIEVFLQDRWLCSALQSIVREDERMSVM